MGGNQISHDKRSAEMNNKHNSHFRHGSGCYECKNCGKQTRDTGEGESGWQLCRKCYDAWCTANGIIDGSYTIEDVPENMRALVEQFL